MEITHVPPASEGGPDQIDVIEGKVTGARPGDQIVVYAKDGIWWVQPFKSRPFTTIQADSTWKSDTHFGSDYAAILVAQGFQASSRLTDLPAEGTAVIASARVKGASASPATSRVIHFSGYDWTVRSSPSDRGGEMNLYDPSNVRVDEKGYLHLRMGPQNDRWSCAEINLTHSLGYGTYRFVVQDSAHLDSSGVLGIFTQDERRGEDTRVELDIELSRWGKTRAKNAQYVVQPYYIPENISRFLVPAGVATHVLRWEPGTAAFSTYSGAIPDRKTKSIYEHTFTSGIPASAAETVHINLYDFRHSASTSRHPSEVVIERFEYLP